MRKNNSAKNEMFNVHDGPCTHQNFTFGSTDPLKIVKHGEAKSNFISLWMLLGAVFEQRQYNISAESICAEYHIRGNQWVLWHLNPETKLQQICLDALLFHLFSWRMLLY